MRIPRVDVIVVLLCTLALAAACGGSDKPPSSPESTPTSGEGMDHSKMPMDGGMDHSMMDGGPHH